MRPDGKISVPLANDVQAAGLTTDELKDVSTKALAEYVTAPDVTVMVREINQQERAGGRRGGAADGRAAGHRHARRST